MTLVTDLREHGLVPVSDMPELAHAARGIPLRSRDGTIKAFAIVDAEDFDRLTTRRWHLHRSGYVQRIRNRGDGRYERETLGREVLGLSKDDPRDCDHRNLDKLDNRRRNLRAVTRGENNENRNARGGRSRHRGVSFHKRDRRWTAQVRHHDRLHHLGYFDTEDEAAAAAAAFRAEHMPFSTN